MGIPITELVISVQGGKSEFQGTWVHPDVAINLGQWCSAKFAVSVAIWVREWMTGKINVKAELPYHIRRYLANRSEIPVTHFSMLNEMIFAFIAPLEESGYTIPDTLLPDISEGRMFCGWLRDAHGVEPKEFPSYRHVFEDGRVVWPRLYPNEWLAEFRNHFNQVWIPTRMLSYFEQRDPKAIPYLQKLLPIAPGVEQEKLSGGNTF